MPLYFVGESDRTSVSVRVTNDPRVTDSGYLYLPVPTAEPPFFRLSERTLRTYFESILELARARGLSSVSTYLPLGLRNENVYCFLNADLGGLILSYDIDLYIILRDGEREVLRDIPSDLPDLPTYCAISGRPSSPARKRIRRVRRTEIEENYSSVDDADCLSDSAVDFGDEPPMLAICESSSAVPPSLVELLANLDEGFALTLLRLIDARGMRDVDVYKKSGVSRQTWYKIMNDRDYRPSKRTVLSFAIALELDLAETHALLATVGFTLSHSLPFDVVIEYFISRGNYDVFAINAVLYSCDLELLGG